MIKMMLNDKNSVSKWSYIKATMAKSIKKGPEYF